MPFKHKAYSNLSILEMILAGSSRVVYTHKKKKKKKRVVYERISQRIA